MKKLGRKFKDVSQKVQKHREMQNKIEKMGNSRTWLD